jgi:3-deoxy-manno-octulosonate cytidylyltransferase (CMP-KDO synthetase)
MELAIVIPARRASARLPEKLLLAESGLPLLAHTLAQCLKVPSLGSPTRVIAAVDCEELQQIAISAGAEAVLTDPNLPSGSDRVWAALEQHPEIGHVVNVQGDEPEIDPVAIRTLLGALHGGAEVATLCAPLPDGGLEDPACVKVVRNLKGQALYFSRAALPFPRASEVAGAKPRMHVGIYGYSRDALRQFARTEPSPLERCEGLEQLRFLEHGIPVEVLDWPQAFPGIDTRADYDAFLDRLRTQGSPSTPDSFACSPKNSASNTPPQ